MATSSKSQGKTHGCASWVIVHRETGRPVMETFSQKVAEAVNTGAYDVVPVGKYLASLNTHQCDNTRGDADAHNQ